ncbi:unnamed protein product [Peronospora destructor]|uniref:PHD-type domain-containing protein n=1 Tax=Peronospora destructor TaxID=86335 RepID=A0AAV0V537_9STRA|nr:unnamed protein product [Peronospora destructor]
MEDSIGKMYQGAKAERPSGKMTEDYKRGKKLPPRVEKMLREQVNLDEGVLHDAFAVAMEDLILEREANFVAKGLCHLCGVNEKHYMPVVNFCPYADENHSLCREHLRSVCRVRLEALFVGRNGATPNRRLLRCLVCAHGCPCTLCRAEKERKVHQYKCYLLDTLRRSGQGSVSAMSDEHATVAVASPVLEERLTHGAVQSSNEGRQYAEYPPTPPAKDRPSVQRDGLPARSLETESAHDGRRLVQPQQLEYKHYPQNSRNGYGCKVQTYSVQMSSTQASSMHASNLLPPRMQASGVQAFSMQPSGIQTQQMHSSRCSHTPKRAENDISANCFSVVGDGVDRGAAARVASPGFTELPSASTILNCSESEKSVVHLLSSLNQGGDPPGSVAPDVESQFSKDSTFSHSQSRYVTNCIVGNNGPSGNAKGFNDIETEAASPVYHARGIADRRRQARDQSYTSSKNYGDSPPRKFSSFGARSTKRSQVLKRKANESDGEASPEPRDSHHMTSRGNFRAPHCGESAASEQRNGDQRQYQPSLKPNGRGKESALQLYYLREQERRDHNNVKQPSLPKEEEVDPRNAINELKAMTKRLQSRQNEEEDKENDEKEDGLESELDTNLDYCEVCQGAGDLVCCDKCPRSFHLKCLHMTETDLPEGDWQCNECKKPSRFDAYAVAVASEKNMLDKCLKIVQCLQSHPFSKQFLFPVENVPLYTRVVKQPMDLSTIENKLKKGAYIVDSNIVADGVNDLDSTLFADDIRLMWSNCKLFNDDGSGIARVADILSAGFERLYKESIAPSLTT